MDHEASVLVLLGSVLFMAVGVWEFFKLRRIGDRLIVAAVVCVATFAGLIVALNLFFDIDVFVGDLSTWEVRGMLALIAFLGMGAGGVVILIERAPRMMESASTTIAEASKAARDHGAAQAEREEIVYQIISEEIENGNVDKATWLKAYERSNGDQQRAKAEYIRLRKKKLVSL